jgi:hypothetical protein
LKLVKSIFFFTAILILGIAVYGQFVPHSTNSNHTVVKATQTSFNLLAEDAELTEDDEGLEFNELFFHGIVRSLFIQTVTANLSSQYFRISTLAFIACPLYLRIQKLSI